MKPAAPRPAATVIDSASRCAGNRPDRRRTGLRARLPAVLTLALTLAGCVNDSASWMIEGRSFALSLVRQQRFFWEQSAAAELVMVRLPDCHRRGAIGSVPLGGTKVELFRPAPGVYAEDILIARTAGGTYALGLDSCEIQPFKTAARIGTPIGAFVDSGSELAFVPIPTKQSSLGN